MVMPKGEKIPGVDFLPLVFIFDPKDDGEVLNRLNQASNP